MNIRLCKLCYVYAATGDGSIFDGAFCSSEADEAFETACGGLDALPSFTIPHPDEERSDHDNRRCDCCGTTLWGERILIPAEDQ